MQKRWQSAERIVRRFSVLAALLLAASVLPFARAAARVSSSPAPVLRVLIVGNSYVRFNVLPHLLARLAASGKSGPRLMVDAEARNGYSLRMHLRAGQAMLKIKSGHYDAVVLQSHSMSAVDHPDELAEDAERFKRAIDATGARTLLYETWPRSPGARLYRKHPRVHSYEDMVGRLDSTFSGLALRIGAQLAPIGAAFERGLIEEPDLALWGPDGSHPTLAGSFLAACVLYGVIASEDPRDASYVPINMKSERGELIKALAERTLAGAHADARDGRSARPVLRDAETPPREVEPAPAEPAATSAASKAVELVPAGLESGRAEPAPAPAEPPAANAAASSSTDGSVPAP